MLRKKLLVILLIVGTLMVPNLLTAQDDTIIPRWSAPEYLGDGWFPSMVTDKTGIAHIIWSQQRDNTALDDLLYYAQRRAYTEGSNPQDIIYTGGGGFTIRNAIDVTSEGILQVAYRSKTAHNIAAAPLDRAVSAAAWLSDEQISDGYYIDLLVDESDIVHVVSSSQGTNIQTLELEDVDPLALQERFPCAFCADLLYFRSTDGGATWSTGTNLSQTIEGSERVEIVEGNSGRLYVTWSEGADWYIGQGTPQDVRMVYSDDQGLTWSEEPIILAGNQPGLKPTQMAFTEMANGSLFAVWRYDDTDRNIYYQISDDVGVTWTEPAAIPGVIANLQSESTLDQYSVITDISGAVHLFAVGFDPITEQGPALFHLEYRQGRWLLPNRIYYNPDVDRPEWPAAAVGPQNELHVAWFVRVGDSRNAADVGTTEVHYAYRTATLPNMPVLVAYAPTPTPTPRVAALPIFQATATVIPTLAPLDPSVNVDTNRDQYAIQTLLGAALAVTVLCGGVLVLAGFRPRSF